VTTDQGREASADDDSFSDTSALLALLVARVTDLGRGPPALVRWVSGRTDGGRYPKELARLLSRALRRATGPAGRTTDTVGEGPPGPSDTRPGDKPSWTRAGAPR
jgi:hypothetical protein